MLSRLAGRAHDVVTAVACARDGRVVSGREIDARHLRADDAAEVEGYVASGEPDDQAGVYAIQGIGGLFVERVEGSPSNVVGLPVRLLYRLAAELGVDLAPGLSAQTLIAGISPDVSRAAARAIWRTPANARPVPGSVAAPTRTLTGWGDGPFPSRQGRNVSPRRATFSLQASRFGLDEEREELVVLPAEEVVRHAQVREERVRDRAHDAVHGRRAPRRARTSSQFARTTDRTERTTPWRRERSSSRSMISSKKARL